MFNYFNCEEIDKFTFYRMPKVLITDDYFKKLSCESKLLYGLLLDRAGLSKKSNWIDEKNRLYVYFKNEEVMDMLNVGKNKAVAMFKELEEIGLIIRKKQGQGKPTRVYVMNFADVLEDVSDIQTSDEKIKKEVLTPENQTSEKNYVEEEVLTPKNQTSRVLKMGSLPFIIENKTEKSKTNLSIYQEKDKKSEVKQKSDVIDEMDFRGKVDEISEYLEIDRLCYNGDIFEEEIKEIVELIAWVMLTPQENIQISGVPTNVNLVRKRFDMLNSSHIEYVFECLHSTETKIKNRRNYLLTCLFKAPITMEGYYDNAVRHDMKSSL